MLDSPSNGLTPEQHVFNQTVDSYKLANLPVLTFKLPLWWRIREWFRRTWARLREFLPPDEL